MTIIIESEPISQLPDSVSEILEQFPALERDAVHFTRRPTKLIENPEQVLYVTQKEYAVVESSDTKIKLLGSDDATTCHIAVIINREASTICLAHLDSAGDREGLDQMIEECLAKTSAVNEVNLELSLFGGYFDEKGKSEALTLKLFDFFHESPVKFHLKTFCVGIVNTQIRKGTNWPLVYGVAVDICSSFTIHPAKFSPEARGPYLHLRAARFLSDEDIGVIR